MNRISNTYRLISLTLAFLVFTTSAGFSIDMHFCQDQLKSISLFGKAKTCHEKSEAAPMKNCPHHKKMMTEKEGCTEDKDCCDNKTLQFQSDQDQQVQSSDFLISKQLQKFVVAYVAVFFTNDLSIESDASSYAQYKPPLIPRDIPVLFESFLL